MSIVGNLIAPGNIEAATIASLNRWMRFYMGEVERLNDLKLGEIPRPPTPESIYGGVDFLSFQQDLLPSLVVVSNPVGEPERSGSVGYSQWYEVQVGALVMTASEDDSRWYAGLYGAAIMGALLQGGYVEDWIQDVTMVGSPANSFVDDDERRVVLCTTTFHVLAAPIVNAQQGPAVPYPEDSPQYGGSPDAPFHDWPTVTETHITVTSRPLTGN